MFTKCGRAEEALDWASCVVLCEKERCFEERSIEEVYELRRWEAEEEAWARDGTAGNMLRAVEYATGRGFLVRVIQKKIVCNGKVNGGVGASEERLKSKLLRLQDFELLSHLTEDWKQHENVIHEVYSSEEQLFVVMKAPKAEFCRTAEVGNYFSSVFDEKRIVCISDTHSQHGKLKIPDGDILIHAGDFTENGTREEAVLFNHFLGTLPHRHKIVIAGNHDFIAQQLGLAGTQKLLTNATYLQDSAVEIDGITIYGSPWQPQFGRGAFQLSSTMMKAVWEKLPENVDILVTHSPPKSILDKARNGKPAGCERLMAKLKTIKPTLHIFGHIHESYGVCCDRHTLFVNASILTAQHQPNNAPVVCETTAFNWTKNSQPIKDYFSHVKLHRERRASISGDDLPFKKPLSSTPIPIDSPSQLCSSTFSRPPPSSSVPNNLHLMMYKGFVNTAS